MANIFVNFPASQEPPMIPTETTSLSIQFDFSHYGIDKAAKAFTLPDSQCLKGSFIIVVEADGLIPGRLYTVTFDLLNPSSSRQVFDPQVVTLYASSIKQKITTIANVDPQYNFILKATIQQTDTQLLASDMVAASCSNLPILPTPTPTPTPIPLTKVLFDTRPVFDVLPPNRCDEQINVIATIHNAQVGKTYNYTFTNLTDTASVVLSPPSGSVTAGHAEQNINTILTANTMQSSLISLQIKVYDAKYPDVIIDEDIILIKCYACKTDNQAPESTPIPTPKFI